MSNEQVSEWVTEWLQGRKMQEIKKSILNCPFVFLSFCHFGVPSRTIRAKISQKITELSNAVLKKQLFGAVIDFCLRFRWESWKIYDSVWGKLGAVTPLRNTPLVCYSVVRHSHISHFMLTHSLTHSLTHHSFTFSALDTVIATLHHYFTTALRHVGHP